MLNRIYEGQVCSLARALEVVGERWTLLIIRDALNGMNRFDDFQRSLGVARNVLTDRLSLLVENGVFERVRYQERPARFEYRLTDVGRELAVAVIALLQWGDRHLAGPAGPPRLTEHPDCGGEVSVRFVCEKCGQVTDDVVTKEGPALLAHRGSADGDGH
jgi:DNA-binding HxlR family transcriptional regulator